jgi:hypothetical protein
MWCPLQRRAIHAMSKTRRGVIQGDDRVISKVCEQWERADTSFLINRTDDLPIEFDGTEVGTGERGNEHRKTLVKIYVTRAKNIIVHVYKERTDSTPIESAEVFADPSAALAWIRGDRTSLGIASKQAWEQACKSVGWLKNHATVRVE